MKAQVLLIFTGLIYFSPIAGQENKLPPARSQVKHITFKPNLPVIKSIKKIPYLVLSYAFADENSNKCIDSDEKSEITIDVSNEGQGIAEKVTLFVSTKNPVQGVVFTPKIFIGDINPEKSVNLKIPVTSDISLQSGLAEFRFEAVESNSFDAVPLEIVINTRKFQAPYIKVIDADFSTDKGGKIFPNYPINLKILIQNIGNGYATDVKLDFRLLRENCFIMGDGITHIDVGNLKPGQAIDHEFVFTVNNRFTESKIPVQIDLKEKYDQYSRDTLLSVDLNQSLQAKREVIQGIVLNNSAIEIASLHPEVDENIPEDLVKYSNKYALIIGNEDYSSKRLGINYASDVIFARRDAEIFSEYLIKTLGFYEENVTYLPDATAAQMTDAFDVLSKLSARTSNAEIVVYFSGHGFPDEKSNVPYLIPVDVTGGNLGNALKLTDLYKKLENSKAKKITIFLDACFSGAGRDAEYLSSRGIRIPPDLDIPPANTIVFSASSGEQSASPFYSKQHGMFTYFLLKKLQETKGEVTYGELADYLKDQVYKQSLKINKKEQDPQVLFGDNNKDIWINTKIK